MIQLTLIMGAIGCLLLGSLIVLRNTRNLVNYLAIVTVYSLAIWLLTILMFIQTPSADLAMVLAKSYYIIASVVVALLALLVSVIPDGKSISRRLFWTVSSLSIFIIGLTVFMPGFIVSDVVIQSGGNYIEANNLSYAISSLYYIGLILFSSFVILRKFIVAKKKQKIQLGLFLVGCLSMTMPGIIADVMLPYANNNYLVWLGIALMACALILVGYVFARRQMIDVRFAVIRSLAYVLSLAFIVVIYYSVATTLTSLFFADNVVSQSTMSVVLGLGLLLVFQPMKRFFDHLTNNVFYKDNYVTDEFFARLNKVLTSTTDLRSLLERTSAEIAMTLNSEQVFFCITTNDGRYVSAGTDNYNRVPKDDAKILQTIKDKKHRVIVGSLLKKSDEVRRLMISHRIELVLPLEQLGISGCLCLGERLGGRYNNRDLRLLGTMAGELVIAIQNTLSIQEVKDVNSNLQQRVANATRELRGSNATLRELDSAKDEFVSMASHQLRTPLTSVKGYISMVLEGDAGKITDTQRQFLEEAYMSSERMVSLINDFLNVSRIQTGKFDVEKHPVNLAKIVEQELEGLLPSASSRNLKFKYKKPENFPIMNLDEGKIRQVVMNFADNAVYYSTENTSIIVSLSVENGSAIFTVKDTGIGVPKSEQDQLFGKFFRATNARKHRPDGNGVGLFLAKKVVMAHGGDIVFKSVEGKGSTFGFSLPIVDLE